MSQTTDRKILVIQTAFLGDLLLSIPLLRSIKEKFPKAHLSLVCRKGLGQLLQELMVIDGFYEIEKGNSKTYKDLLKQLKGVKYEFIFSPHQSLRTACFVSGLNAGKKIGFATWWNHWFFNERLERNLNLPDALRQLSLLGAIDNEIKEKISMYSKEHPSKTLGPVPQWASMGIYTRSEKKKAVCLFPGSVWATKRWTLQGFTDVAKYFSNLGYEVILLGSQDEAHLGDQISQSVPQARQMMGQINLFESLKWIATSELVVTNDSGGQHLAAIAGIPTVSVFGPTVLSLGYRPWNPQTVVVENEHLQCRPCGKHGHQQCPIGTHECMTGISSQAVIQACRSLLKI